MTEEQKANALADFNALWHYLLGTALELDFQERAIGIRAALAPAEVTQPAIRPSVQAAVDKMTSPPQNGFSTQTQGDFITVVPTKQPAQEPMGWQVQNALGGWSNQITMDARTFPTWAENGWKYRPLYDHPPAPASDALLAVFKELIEQAGWRGNGPLESDHFYCENCHQAHKDFSLIEHLPNCLILRCRDLIQQHESGQ